MSENGEASFYDKLYHYGQAAADRARHMVTGDPTAYKFSARDMMSAMFYMNQQTIMFLAQEIGEKLDDPDARRKVEESLEDIQDRFDFSDLEQSHYNNDDE